MLMHGVRTWCTRRCTDTVREPELEGNWEKIPYRTGEWNVRQRRAGLTLYQLSYIPIFAHVISHA